MLDAGVYNISYSSFIFGNKPKAIDSTLYIGKTGVDEKEEVIDLPFEINGFEYQIEEVSNCIREGKLESEVMSWQDSIEVMKIMDEVARRKSI